LSKKRILCSKSKLLIASNFFADISLRFIPSISTPSAPDSNSSYITQAQGSPSRDYLSLKNLL